MNLWRKLLTDRNQREKWDAGLAWFRLRYQEAGGATRCLNLLSRSEVCGRVALYYLPGDEVSQLYLGLQRDHSHLIHRMAQDFGFTVKLMPPEWDLPAAQRLSVVDELSWHRPFVAHLVKGFVFGSWVDDRDSPRGRYLPQPRLPIDSGGPDAWQLPVDPPPGLSTRPDWSGYLPPKTLVASEPDPRFWLLGWTLSKVPLHVAGRVNLYGGSEAVADWLVHQLTQTVAIDPANLIIIDGAGDLVPQLKRKAAVTRLLGEQLVYMDIDSDSMRGGFNPLAPVPGETEAALVARWQQWFAGMQVHGKGVGLLGQARQDGVADLPSLRKWLESAERRGQYPGIPSLMLALNRLTASRGLREWLEWPTNRFAERGALLFACRATGWEREQLLQAAALAAHNIPDARLVLHGFPWSMFNVGDLAQHQSLAISNGPRLAQSAVVLVQANPQPAAKLSARFLGGRASLTENLELLQKGEGMVVHGEEIVFVTWRHGRWPAAMMGSKKRAAAGVVVSLQQTRTFDRENA